MSQRHRRCRRPMNGSVEANALEARAVAGMRPQSVLQPLQHAPQLAGVSVERDGGGQTRERGLGRVGALRSFFTLGTFCRFTRPTVVPGAGTFQITNTVRWARSICRPCGWS